MRKRHSVSAIARRQRIPLASRLPESKALPPIDVAVKRGTKTPLRHDEVTVMGWMSAPASGSVQFQRKIARLLKKNALRERYERRYKRGVTP